MEVGQKYCSLIFKPPACNIGLFDTVLGRVLIVTENCVCALCVCACGRPGPDLPTVASAGRARQR